MKIEFETKFKIGQTVWIVEEYYDGYRTEKHTILGYAYYGDNDMEYFLDDTFDDRFLEWRLYEKYKDARTKCTELNKANKQKVKVTNKIKY